MVSGGFTYAMGNFSWFKVSGFKWLQVVSGGFRSFLVLVSMLQLVESKTFIEDTYHISGVVRENIF